MLLPHCWLDKFHVISHCTFYCLVWNWKCHLFLLRFYLHFRSSHRKCSIRKSVLQLLLIFLKQIQVKKSTWKYSLKKEIKNVCYWFECRDQINYITKVEIQLTEANFCWKPFFLGRRWNTFPSGLSRNHLWNLLSIPWFILSALQMKHLL